MFKPFTTKNLLSEWYQKAHALSSPFALKTLYPRDKVDFIYKSLQEFFGLSFFAVSAGTDKTIDKISWLFGLLSTNKSIPCYHALYDVCLLIEYSKTLDDSIQKEMKQLKKNPENLRAFFFELFIYRLFDLNRVKNAKKVVCGNQVLEGTCELDGKTFLFECRKAFMPKIHELDVLRRILTDIYLLGQEFPLGVGMICTIKLTRPVAGIHLSDMREKLRGFFKKLSGIKSRVTIQYTHGGEFGTFSAIDYDEAALIDIQAKKDYDVLYYVKPPRIPVPGVPDFYRARISCTFSIAESQVYKKLETMFKEKKRQHRNSPFQNKIIFLDSESLPEFHMNIFQNDSMYIPEMIQQAYTKAGLKDILCIVRRSYNDDGPFVLADVIAPPHLQVAGSALKSMLLENYNDIRKLNLSSNQIIIQ